MKRWWTGWVAVALLGACGPPIEKDPEPIPPECAPGECDPPPVQNQSLWPMTVGSTWTYEIDDPLHGRWVKKVRVDSKGTIPGTDREGVLFISEQPHLVERSWQLEEEGLAKRAVEEDRDPAGTLKRQTRWAPLTIKALTLPQAAGWESRVHVIETIQEANGETKEKDKVFVWKVVEVDVPVTLGGNGYKAIKVLREREDKSGHERLYWLVPGIGKVREEGERTEVLTGFTIQPPQP